MMQDKQKVYVSFEGYVRDWPDGEMFRAWLTRSGRLQLIFPGEGPHEGLPGGYLWADVMGNGPYQIFVHDSDDGAIMKEAQTAADLAAEIEILAQMAPVSMWELVEVFNYEWSM